MSDARQQAPAVELVTRIRTKDATVAVVGLGYAGLPLAHAFSALVSHG